MPKAIARWALAGVLALGMPLAAAEAQQAPTRAITRIAGDLYRFQNNFHYSVFLVTPEGVIATDPINADAARWLEQEIEARFGQPIRYVVYSHDHADHISGGEVWADTAVIVAHENARRAIVGEKRPTAVPVVTFSDRLTIELGGKRVEVAHVGRNHSDNSVVMRFPDERVLFAVDFIPVKAVAFRDLPDAWIPDWMESLRRVEQMEFDALAPGHGPMGTKADVTAFREYMADLHGAVLEAIRAGQSLEEAQAAIKLDKYKDWEEYGDYLPLNIKGMYERVALHRRGNP